MATKEEVKYCIDLISKYAIENYKNSKVLPSLVVAQACFESGYLTSELAKNGKNPFGIKYNSNITDEYYMYKNSKWCKFKSFEIAVKAQGEFYNLYDRYKGIVGETDIEKVLVALEKSGYCEGSGYSNNIRRMIDTYDLLKYDNEVLKKQLKYDTLDVSKDEIYQDSLSVFIDKGIVSDYSWTKQISTKNAEALVTKTCKHIYGTNTYSDGISTLQKNNVISSIVWNNVENVKANHIRDFIIKLSKII